MKWKSFLGAPKDNGRISTLSSCDTYYDDDGGCNQGPTMFFLPGLLWQEGEEEDVERQCRQSNAKYSYTCRMGGLWGRGFHVCAL